MLFPYQEDRPSITFQLKFGDRWKYFSALIDSGADFSIFPMYAAIALGINIKKLKKIQAEAADGDFFDIYKTTLEAKINNIFFQLPIGFSEKPNVNPLIGREGFFDTFKITFDHKKRLTIINKY